MSTWNFFGEIYHPKCPGGPIWSIIRSKGFSGRDLLTAFAVPYRSPRGPCKLKGQSGRSGIPHSPGFAHFVRTSLPACGGALQNTNKKGDQVNLSPFSLCFAESEGFEPPDPLRSTVFKTAAFDHSANSPICFPFVRDCKGTNYFETCKLFFTFFAFF